MTTSTFDPWAAHASVLREKVFEHIFLADMTRALLQAGRRCEVLRAEFDGSGFDLALEADGVLRHIQLKAMRADGKRSDVDIHTALAAKPSGCVIWMLVDPVTFATTAWRWFGGAPGEPLPSLGDKIVRHAKANSEGEKTERPDLRKVGRGRFETVATMDSLIERLFGDAHAREILRLKAHLARQPVLACSAPAWMRLVQQGMFDALPEQVNPDESVDLAHMVDGYALAGLGTPDAIQMALAGRRPDNFNDLGPAALWAAMFVEHRRLRFGQGESKEDLRWFEDAYARLRHTLASAIR
ncbi:hypothetical protein BH10PSE2_BH10PSE2_10600 [soil metagenome]